MGEGGLGMGEEIPETPGGGGEHIVRGVDERDNE